jgi:hypothetical protein
LSGRLSEACLEKIRTLSTNPDELAKYYRTMHESNEPEMGEAMLRGIEFVALALSRTDPDRVTIISVT